MLSRLREIPQLVVSEDIPLRPYTRFDIGGPARLLIDVQAEESLPPLLAALRSAKDPVVLIGGGTNLIASDQGVAGAVIRYAAGTFTRADSAIHVQAGAELQDVVDFGIDCGLRGLETLTGIPGWVGGAIYGNAGAYGHSMQERVESVRFFDGSRFQEIGRDACEFAYRDSVFKRRKDWIIVSAVLRLEPGNFEELRQTADEIAKIRNEKYPPSMCCAGSIFKNLLLADLPESVRARVPERVIREGKVPSAYFLEAAGAKGMRRGGIQVADYHANLIYNTGGGTSADLCALIELLKARVLAEFGLALEEEVQYVS